MRKFTWKSYAALITSLYSFSYFQISQKYDQDHIASGSPALLPYEPIWLFLYFLSPFFSMAIITWGILQNKGKKEKKEEENLWLYRTSIIIVIFTVFHYVNLWIL